VTAACDHAFGPLGLHRIEAEVDPGNVPSNRLLAGVGFVLEGRLRQRWIDRGAAHDTNIYGLLAADWRSAPALA
jgi:[ribosomal protein S5]-alanine N-acetyltransferase